MGEGGVDVLGVGSSPFWEEASSRGLPAGVRRFLAESGDGVACLLEVSSADRSVVLSCRHPSGAIEDYDMDIVERVEVTGASVVVGFRVVASMQCRLRMELAPSCTVSTSWLQV